MMDEFEVSARQAGLRYVIGLDEVGRGSLAGPVAVGAIFMKLPLQDIPEGIRDSKTLSAKKRENLFPELSAWAACSGVGYASAKEIDDLGILPAQRLATIRVLQEIFGKVSSHLHHDDSEVLRQGLESATPHPAIPIGLMIDGSVDWIGSLAEDFPAFDCSARILRPKLDTQSVTVAAAAILAKVSRDRLMTEAAKDFPEYLWQKNSGYGTAEHRERIILNGPTPLHRHSWLKKILNA